MFTALTVTLFEVSDSPSPYLNHYPFSNARESKLKALHTVSAWSSEHRLVLGQTKVNAKSNEITAIPELLDMLDISGCIITIDAMGTQKLIAEKIIAESCRLYSEPKRQSSNTTSTSQKLV